MTLMVSDTTLQDIFREIQQIRKEMVHREDIESLIDTIELMGSPEKMALLQKSEADIRKGRVKEVDSVDDLLSESSA